MLWNGPPLLCPRDRRALLEEGDALGCALGHRYPVVDGIPVLLRAEALPAIDVGARSLLAARAPRSTEPHAELFVDTLGIAEHEKRGVLELAQRGGDVDPVVAYMVGATSGYAYEAVIGALHSYPIPVLRLPPGEQRWLLDVGCNWGRWSIAAARAGYQVVGIDPSLGAVAAARRVCESMGLRAAFCVGDARALPFAPQAFDSVFSYSVLQHFSEEDAGQALNEIGRVLRAGGRATIQMANALGVRSLYHQARRGFRATRDFEVRYRTPQALRRAFEAHVGPTELSVDCYFGLGLQASDSAMLPVRARTLIAASEALRRVAARLPALSTLADSVYLTAVRAG